MISSDHLMKILSRASNYFTYTYSDFSIMVDALDGFINPIDQDIFGKLPGWTYKKDFPCDDFIISKSNCIGSIWNFIIYTDENIPPKTLSVSTTKDYTGAPCIKLKITDLK